MPPEGNQLKMSQEILEEQPNKNMQPQDQEKKNTSTIELPAGVHSNEGSAPEAVREMPEGGSVVESHYKNNSDRAAILSMAEEFATQSIGALSSNYAYHCIEHTKQVVQNARIIADGILLSNPGTLTEYDEFLMLVAAWFHDVGFKVTYSGHEMEGCRAARKLLTGVLSREDVLRIEGIIMSTEIPQNALNLLEHIVCDADLFYLGGDQFSLWSNRLREEHCKVLGCEYTDLEWIQYNIDFIRSHAYFTEFAKARNDAGRDENLRKLEATRDALLEK